MIFSYAWKANVVLAREFARRYGDKGIVSVSLNPGKIKHEAILSPNADAIIRRWHQDFPSASYVRICPIHRGTAIMLYNYY